MAKYIITEGETDSLIIRTLFHGNITDQVSLKAANGFSNVIGIYKTLSNHGYEVLAVLDTDTDHPGIDNRKIMERLMDTPMIGRNINIVWMDPNIEGEISKVCPISKRLSCRNMKNLILNNKAKLLELEVFTKISEFIG